MKSSKQKSIQAMTVTMLGEGAPMITSVPQTIAGDRWSPVCMGVIANHGTNAMMRKAPRMNDANRNIGSIARSPATTYGFNEPGKNKHHLWRPLQPWL